jgi:stringent starvation protein B
MPKMENEALIEFLRESGKGLTVENNIIYAEKAFMIRSVIDWCFEQKEAGYISNNQVRGYVQMINEYVEDKVILFWESPGRLGVLKVRKDKEKKDDEQ